MLSQELEAIPSNQVAVNTLHSPLTDDDITVYYATDLHINHTLGNMPDNISIFDKLESLVSNLSVQGVLLLGGDMSDNSVLNKRFLYRLKNCFTNIIYVLGNHEYWQFESVREAEDYYRGICSEHLILLNNSIVYFTTEYADGYYGSCKLPIRFVLRPHILSNEQLLSMSVKQIQGTLSAARLVIFGGAGFAGYDETSPECCIFNGRIDRHQELERSKLFEHLYRKLLPVLQNTNSIVLTHMPKSCWCVDSEYDTGIIYVSGHTHKNYYYDDGSVKIYNDAQTGYHRKDLLCKRFHMNATYDIFKSYDDGIHIIKSQDYIDFLRGKNLDGSYAYKNTQLYMLKREGYYMLVSKSKSGNLSILNGGGRRRLLRNDLQYYYDNLLSMIDIVLGPVRKWDKYTTEITNIVRGFGGSGRLHGSIVDIDFYNHLYIDSATFEIYPYYALSMIDKWFYPNIQLLLEERCPELLPDFKAQHLDLQLPAQISEVTYVDSTDMYARSREIYKMQKIKTNILTVWYEHMLTPRLE